MSQSVQNLVQSKWQDAYNQLSGQHGVTGLISFVQVDFSVPGQHLSTYIQAWDIAVSILRPRPLHEPLSTVASGTSSPSFVTFVSNLHLEQAAAAFELIHAAKMTQCLIDKFVSACNDLRLDSIFISF